MEETFSKLKTLKSEGKNDVDNLVKWMKDSNLIGDSKPEEDKLRDLFKDSANNSDVDFGAFKDALGKLATEQKKNVEEMMQTLVNNAPAMFEQLKATASSAAGAAKDAASSALAAFK